MTNLWVTFSTDISRSFTEISGNIIYNLNNIYNFNGNVIDTTSNFIIYELSNNPIQSGIQLKTNNWKQLNLNTILNPFQGYWLGGINTNLPQIFTSRSQLVTAIDNWIINPNPVANNYGLIENWNVQNINDMSQLFINKTNFNSNISNWNVGNVQTMENMFKGAISFNQDLNNWNVGNVQTMENMFNGAITFNQDLNNWNVGNVTNMNSMFQGASSFNSIISNWDVGNVTDMRNMFNGATSFNGNISNWNLGNVTNMNFMFYEATSFNQDISNWNVGNVKTMQNMFDGATNFNGNISNWDVGNVTNMNSMFQGASSFNSIISNWDVGNVTNMNSMFQGASSFNQDISNWDVGNVTDMRNMFNGATSFNQDISNWDVGNVTDGNLNEMFKNVSSFTNMIDKIHSNGTPFNYFISQRNTYISVSIRSYSLIEYNGAVLFTLTETFSDGADSDSKRIQNALSITSMGDLVYYSFTSSENSTSRDILSLYSISQHQNSGNIYYYYVSGPITTQNYSRPGPYTLNFTRKT